MMLTSVCPPLLVPLRAPDTCNSLTICHQTSRSKGATFLCSACSPVEGGVRPPLWEVAPGQHFWGNVPGTDTNAYYDTNHLLALGARYLSPYMCSAFEGWGFFTPAQVSG